MIRLLHMALLGLSLAACSHGDKVQCTTEVTAGTGTVKATAAGTRAEAERESLRQACNGLCARGKDLDEACAARCTVDAAAGKIGAHTTCAASR